MSRATGTIKYLLFFFNTIWAILGIVVLLFAGLGWDAMPLEYAIGIVVLGGAIFIISLFGCFGALRESARTLWIYSTFLLVLLILIIIFIIFGTQDAFKNYALDGVDYVWQRELLIPGSMDPVQKTYACCGRLEYLDYLKIGRHPPSTCCKDNNCINPLNLYTVGCMQKVQEAFADEALITKCYQWGLLGFDLLLLTLAVILAIHYTNRERRYNY